MSCVEQMGFSGTFFLALLPQARPIKRSSTFKNKGLLIQFQSRCALGEFCFSLASAIPRLVGPGCNYISSFYPAEAKAAIHAACVSP